MYSGSRRIALLMSNGYQSHERCFRKIKIKIPVDSQTLLIPPLLYNKIGVLWLLREILGCHQSGLPEREFDQSPFMGLTPNIFLWK
jgi:hypothetical protein